MNPINPLAACFVSWLSFRVAVGTEIAPRPPRTDPYVRLDAYGSYLGCLTTTLWFGQSLSYACHRL